MPLLEVIMAVAMTLAFFSGFLALLSVAFPPGDDLRTLMAGVRVGAPSEGSLRTLGADLIDPLSVATSPVAKLVVWRRDVKRRLAGQISWTPALSGTQLHDRDAIQTGPSGRASIQFEPRVGVQVEENALVVISGARVGTDPIESPQRGLALLEGDLLAHIEGSRDAQISVEIPTGHALLQAPGGKAEVRLGVHRDRSTSVAVLGGSLELAASGRRIQLGARQFSRVDSGGRIQEPRPVPETPEVLGPADAAAFTYLDLPPRITFQWSPVGGADRYRVRVAKDAAFHTLALDETVTTPSLTWGRLAVGSFFWSVAAIQDEIEGVPSSSRKLTVEREDLVQPLRVEAPPAEIHSSQCMVRGTTGPRARVYVMGQEVVVKPDGSFAIKVPLKAGANLILVEAVDPAGHSSYWSQVVLAKF